jgi:thymidylate synthase
LDLRANRTGVDLVHDSAEEELLKEMALIIEIRHIYEDSLKQIEVQLKNNKSAKARVEFDWSDKVISYDTESVNIHLHKQSDTILMRPGSVRIPEE